MDDDKLFVPLGNFQGADFDDDAEFGLEFHVSESVSQVVVPVSHADAFAKRLMDRSEDEANYCPYCGRDDFDPDDPD